MILTVLIFDLDEHFSHIVPLILYFGSHESVLLTLAQRSLDDLLSLYIPIEVCVPELVALDLRQFHQLLYGPSEVAKIHRINLYVLRLIRNGFPISSDIYTHLIQFHALIHFGHVVISESEEVGGSYLSFWVRCRFRVLLFLFFTLPE